MATRKDLARRAVQRLTETDRSSEAECNVSLYKERWTTTRHYDNALNGIYQFGPAGEILRINLSFAVMLGYESALHLQSEHRAIAELFGDPEEARQMLYTLREEPHRRLAVNLRLRNGKTHPFWIMSLPQNGDESEPVEGFLIDREQDVLLEKARRERDQAMERGSSLAMLLAATCLQTQAYFAPRPLEGETCAPEPAVPGRERRRSINSLKDIFDDIYRIGMSASEDAALVMVPIDVYHLMDRVYRQALPAMGAKNIDLTLDVEPDMDVRVSGSEALLCHTLLRCLFMITAPVSGGSAILGVSRDPYTTPPPGKVRFIFSASWLPNMDVPADAPFGAGECLEPNPMADNAMTAPAMSPLELKDEWAVIDYLVRRMNGDPLGTAVTHNARAVQFMVQLDTSELEQQTTGAKAETSEFSFAEAAATAAVESEAFDSQLSAGTLDILVSDQMSDDTETETAGPGLNILLVDDSPNTRMLFSLYLKDTRHRITEAYNGQEGVEAFGAKTFDVVFMDLEMPLMDGYQATRIIRAMEADSGSRPTPIVAVTGYTLPEARQECMLSGCTEFLAKPFSKNALLSMLEALELMRRREA